MCSDISVNRSIFFIYWHIFNNILKRLFFFASLIIQLIEQIRAKSDLSELDLLYWTNDHIVKWLSDLGLSVSFIIF